MGFDERLPEKLAVQVGVNLGGGDGCMAQPILNSTQVRPPFHQMGGERMPEGMRADFFGDFRGGCQLPDDHKDHYPGMPASPPVQAKEVFVTLLDRMRTRLNSSHYCESRMQPSS